jgi:hypothetical protein
MGRHPRSSRCAGGRGGPRERRQKARREGRASGSRSSSSGSESGSPLSPPRDDERTTARGRPAPRGLGRPLYDIQAARRRSRGSNWRTGIRPTSWTRNPAARTAAFVRFSLARCISSPARYARLTALRCSCVSSGPSGMVVSISRTGPPGPSGYRSSALLATAQSRREILTGRCAGCRGSASEAERCAITRCLDVTHLRPSRWQMRRTDPQNEERPQVGAFLLLRRCKWVREALAVVTRGLYPEPRLERAPSSCGDSRLCRHATNAAFGSSARAISNPARTNPSSRPLPARHSASGTSQPSCLSIRSDNSGKSRAKKTREASSSRASSASAASARRSRLSWRRRWDSCFSAASAARARLIMTALSAAARACSLVPDTLERESRTSSASNCSSLIRVMGLMFTILAPRAAAATEKIPRQRSFSRQGPKAGTGAREGKGAVTLGAHAARTTCVGPCEHRKAEVPWSPIRLDR